MLIFLQFYCAIAKENLDKMFKDLSQMKRGLNFWLSFAQNFKDNSFIQLIQSKDNTDKTTFIKKKIKEIIIDITTFLQKHFSSQEQYQPLLEQGLFELLEMIVRFNEMFNNILNSSLKEEIIDEHIQSAFIKSMDNISLFANVKIDKLSEALYEKIGYAFLDFKGNFIWADKYTQEMLFEHTKIDQINLFELFTDFSKYIIHNKYGDKFFDFKEESSRIRVFTYTINLSDVHSHEDGTQIENKNNKCLQHLYENFNSTKTLVSRASAVLLQNFGDNNKSNACILLETKLSRYRQNFDYFHWKKYID